MKKVVIYISGPYRGPSTWAIENNIRRAEALALEVWKAPGFYAICPHSNTRFFQDTLPDTVWLDGSLEIMKRCDAVLLTKDWIVSAGARTERLVALDSGIPVFENLGELKEHFLYREPK